MESLTELQKQRLAAMMAKWGHTPEDLARNTAANTNFQSPSNNWQSDAPPRAPVIRDIRDLKLLSGIPDSPRGSDDIHIHYPAPLG